MAVANDTAGHGRHRRPLVPCPACGVAFLAGMTGGRRQIHCSSACEVAARKRRAAADPLIPLRAITSICYRERGAPINLDRAIKTAGIANNKAIIAARNRRRVAACKCVLCGAGIAPGITRPKKYCHQCSGKAPSEIRNRRAAKSRRRARQRGLVHQSIDPILVFERDRWRCKLCGTRTPKAKRGTIDPDAPELDHIVPLALGGTRTWGNVQCACRACNQKKGATPLGQVGFDFAA